MKNCILALPALLRAGTFLAIANPTTFNPQDDLLAYPQFDISFTDDFVSEQKARAHLISQEQQADDASSHLERYRPSNGDTGDERSPGDPDVTYESMTLEGQRYLCSLPRIKPGEERPGSNDTLSKAEEEKELARAKDRGWELLSGMEGNCVYFLSGWWSYKFCYNDVVRQFHQLPPSAGVPPYPPKEDPGEQGFTLGKYSAVDEKARLGKVNGRGDGEEVKDASNLHNGKLVQRGDRRYLVQTLVGGTLCDLTRRGRRTEVQFHCNPQSPDRISLIKETSTCDYLMIIQTPRLCQDVAFLPPKIDQPNTITCSPILAEDEVDEYKAHLSSIQNSAKAAAATKKHYPPLRQVVGDIEIGARSIVPADLKLEKSIVVGGGKGTYVDTVAASDGTVLGKEALERLGLGDPEGVAQLKKMLEARAQGQDWRLDVIDTPRGREYRAVIGSNDEDGDESKGDDMELGKKETGKGSGKAKGKVDEDDGEESEGSKEEYFKDEL